MVSGEVDELWFNIRHGVLKPGKNPLRLTCEVSASSHDICPMPFRNVNLPRTWMIDLGLRDVCSGKGSLENREAGLPVRFFAGKQEACL